MCILKNLHSKTFAFIMICFLLPSLLTFAQNDTITTPITLDYSVVSYFPANAGGDAYPLIDLASRQNLFLPLFRYDLETRTAVPSLVKDYLISNDGLVYTFNLRSDVSWVHVKDGQIVVVRPITADDAVRGINQRCKSADYLLPPFLAIKDCNGRATATGLKVISDNSFTITLTHPASYLPIALTMPFVAPIPKENPTTSIPRLDQVLTNGPFAIQSLKKQGDIRIFVLLHNQFLPSDLQGSGNIERVIIRAYDGRKNQQSYQTVMDDFQASKSALAVLRTFNSSGTETTENGLLPQIVKVLIFNPDKPPFDKVEIRRAFSAAIDRTQIKEVAQFGNLPADHFGPSSFSGSLSSETTDMLGFNADYARAQLATAGYADCKDIPKITFTIDQNSQDNANELVTQFKNILGCTDNTFEIKTVGFDVYNRTVAGDITARFKPLTPNKLNKNRPNLWLANTNGSPSVPDQVAATGFYLNCDISPWGVPCTSAQDIIAKTNSEQDVSKRAELWAEIEKSFFGQDGSFPVAPLDFIPLGAVNLSSTVKGTPDDYYGFISNWTTLTVDNSERLKAFGINPIEKPTATDTLQLNKSLKGAITETEKAMAFIINTSDGKPLNVAVIPSNGSKLDPVIVVYDANGQQIAMNDDFSSKSVNAQINNLKSDTNLTVVIYAFEDGSRGDFTIKLTKGK